MTDKDDTKDGVRSMVQKFQSFTTIDPNLNEETSNEASMSRVKHSSSLSSMQDRSGIFAVDENWTMKDPPCSNVPEKILFVVDTSREPDCTNFETRNSSNFSPLYMIKRVIEIFVSIKLGMQPEHEFALMTLSAGEVFRTTPFTSNRKIFASNLEQIKEDEASEEQEFYDLGPCFERIASNVDFMDDRRPPMFVPRVILLYARSRSIPQFATGCRYFDALMRTPNFFLDSLYVHEPLGEDNKCQEVYARLASMDVNRTSYILEVGRNAAALHTNMAKLLAHPLQRARQDNAPYSFHIPQEVRTNV